MTYVEQNLIAGEKVLYRTGLHWVTLVGPIVAGAVFGLPGFMLLATAALVHGSGGSFLTGFCLLALGVLFIGLGMWRRSSTEMAVTNKRIVVKSGRLGHTTFELFLNKIESIGVVQPVVGRMLGYGSVVIRGTGGTPEPFPNVNKPLEFRRQVQQQIELSDRNKAA